MASWIQLLLLALIIGAAELSSATNFTEITTSGDEESASYTEPLRNLFQMHPKSTIVVEIEETQQEILLPCAIDGNPQPNNFTWRKNGRKIQNNTDYYFYEGSFLKITELTSGDSGSYTCSACNSFGCLDSSLNFRAFYKIVDHSMRNMSVLVNSSAILFCNLYIKPNVNYTYHLFKRKFAEMKYLIDLSGTTNLLLPTKRTYFSIDHAKLEDAGWYTCVVTSNNIDYIYAVIGHKSAYLHVVTKFESNYIMTGSAALVTIVTCTVLVIFGRRRVKNRTKYYPRWIKKVTVTRNDENTELEEFQIPIVKIHQSMVVENHLYNSVSVSLYQYTTDWEWEVQRCRISLGKLLGEGAFGQVVQAEAFGFSKRGKTISVAVKMLKESHSDDDVENLVCELEIMKMVGRHPNVINLLGCCTNDGPLYVIMEHAIHGSLKGFLLEHILESDEAEKKTITIQQLVSFASQIASGMVYLSSIKCVHRDLAARNILVAEGLVMKISDFGLARDIHHQEYYRKLTAGRMPICWMAPESLEFLFFDTKTDVWSFGVLLWEIMTLEGQPYQFLPAAENLLEYLKKGHRLEQSRCCPDKVYLVMNQCWQDVPEERSSFIEIVEQLKTCLDEVPDGKLDLNHDE